MRGHGRIFLRGEIYWASYYLHGVEHRESTKETDEKEAWKFLRRRLDEIGADRIGAKKFVSPKQSRMKIRELIAALRAKFEKDGQLSPQNASELKKLEEYFGDIRATQLTSEKVDAYIKEKRAEQYADATINRSLVFLTRSYTLAIERGHLNSKPFIEYLPVKNARQGFFEDRDFRKVYAELPDDLKDYCLFSFLTAWRKGEVSCLKWKYLENGVLRIPAEETKNGITRSVVIAGELTEIIERRKAAAVRSRLPIALIAPPPDDCIFHRGGQPILEFRKAWASACRKAGFAGKIFHDLRRSGVRNMIRSGIQQHVAMKISGHETVSMFKRYDICNEDDLRAAAESVQRYNATQSANAATQQSSVVSMAKQ